MSDAEEEKTASKSLLCNIASEAKDSEESKRDDFVSRVLRDIDRVDEKVLTLDMKKTLKDVVLYSADMTAVVEALDLYFAEGNKFLLRRMADHSDAAERVKRERRCSKDYIHPTHQVKRVPDRLKLDATNQSWLSGICLMYNELENREATGREVFMKYDESQSGYLDRNGMVLLLGDMGFAEGVANASFEMVLQRDADTVPLDDFEKFYSLLVKRVKGTVEENKETTIEELKGRSQELSNDVNNKAGPGFQYLQLVEAAELFYGNISPTFDKGLIREIERYIRMLYDGAIITDAMFERAMFLLDIRDKYTIFALYKYYIADAINEQKLRTYLQYKVDSETRVERRVQYHMEREESFIRYKKQNKEMIRKLRDDVKEEREKAQAMLDAIVDEEVVLDDEEEDSDAENEQNVVESQSRPRWLQLYEDKNWAKKVEKMKHAALLEKREKSLHTLRT